VGRVWVTRTEGPAGADYEAGLLFRATLAGSAGAGALISIHNNASPDGPFEGPGSEIFFMFKDPDSRRLGGLLIEEMRRSFSLFDIAWVGDTDAGAKYRLQEDGETDYYGILRRALVPSVIAEGGFISSEPEEALLATPDFRQAYADAIYRALVRFLTTDDPGSGFTTPYLRTTPVGSGDAQPTCRVPAQP
jgi:N-acetylmuramoyl-L-alanine amidase